MLNMIPLIFKVIDRFIPDAAAKEKAKVEAVAAYQAGEFKLLELETTDRDSARKREMSVQDSTPTYLAWGVTAGFFSVLFILMFGEVNTPYKDLLYVMLGSLGTAWSGIISYYFGSSAGSRIKDLTTFYDGGVDKTQFFDELRKVKGALSKDEVAVLDKVLTKMKK